MEKEICSECNGEKETVWKEDGFEIKQVHKKDCPVLIELRKKYNN